MSSILVTGAAGFIGMHVTKALLARGESVIGIDNLNDYYDPQLKQDRLTQLARLDTSKQFSFERCDIADMTAISALFERTDIDRVVHLAAQAGVRYSIDNPHAYAQSNLVGFVNMLEACRHNQVKHLVYASSSSVYGGNATMPFSEAHAVDHPVSLYAATKKANELMAHSYSHLYQLPTTGLRFFTVYGPWGRPDMAPMLFADAILKSKPIKVFNHGNMKRDFTFIDDIVTGVLGALDHPPSAQPDVDRARLTGATSWAPYKVLNIGSSTPIPLMEFIGTLEEAIGIPAKLEFHPMAPGDVASTYADMTLLEQWTGTRPMTSLKQGISAFVSWYRSYY